MEETTSIRKGLLQKAKDLQSQNEVAKIAHDKLIVYEKERENNISEAQGDPQVALKLIVKGCGYLITNVNKRLSFKYNTKFIRNESI